MIAIEKGIKPKKRLSYPFADMKVGDSFVVDFKYHASVRTLSTQYGKKLGRIFKTQVEEKQVRCFRIK